MISSTEVATAGGPLATFTFGSAQDRAPLALAVHGTTSNSHTWLAVARALRERVSLIAPDLRGRGRSNLLGEPYGIAQHVGDMLAILDQFQLERVVLVGHSLGAYVTAQLAAQHRERVTAVVLVDGGLPVPGAEGADPQRFLDSFLGPALARLKMTFPTYEDYRAWWRSHPALADSDVSEPDLAAYADHDLVGQPPQLRSSVAEQAVRADAADLFELGDVASRLEVQSKLLCAPRGLKNDPNPMQPLPPARAWAGAAPAEREAIEVPDVNHYTLVLGRRGASVVADAIAELVAAG